MVPRNSEVVNYLPGTQLQACVPRIGQSFRRFFKGAVRSSMRAVKVVRMYRLPLIWIATRYNVIYIYFLLLFSH